MHDSNLLIVGAGVYGMLASEIATEMSCFDEIDFVDDQKVTAYNGESVVGTTAQIPLLAENYRYIIVAIGNPHKKLEILNQIERDVSIEVVSLVSPRAYVAPSARIGCGCIIEPMAVVHTGSVLERGCIVSAGAVINHFSVCSEGVHVDCNATIEGFCTVPARTKIHAGQLWKM